jgi:transcriptional regulator with XRE-family HTH domain
MSEYAREFGKHVRSLRRARGVTQDALAQRSGLSADTIRRIEHGSFSASIDTLRKLCSGLGVAPSTLFESFELGRTDERSAPAPTVEHGREVVEAVDAHRRGSRVVATVDEAKAEECEATARARLAGKDGEP